MAEEEGRMKDLYIIGAGGCGRDTAWLVERINNILPTWRLKGFVDDNDSIVNTEIDGYKVLGDISFLNSLSDIWAVCAVANVKERKKIVNKIRNAKFATLIDPSVVMSNRISIGEGSIVFANTVISLDINIGKHVIVGLESTIGHDVVVQDYVSIYPGVHLSGNVTVNQLTEIGTGANIIQGINLGSESVIGMGAAVLKDVPDCCTMVGNPANEVFRHKKWNI